LRVYFGGYKDINFILLTGEFKLISLNIINKKVKQNIAVLYTAQIQMTEQNIQIGFNIELKQIEKKFLCSEDTFKDFEIINKEVLK